MQQDKNLAEISLWEMKIALVVLYLACDYRDKALTLLNKIPQNLLVYYCSQNPKLLDGKLAALTLADDSSNFINFSWRAHLGQGTARVCTVDAVRDFSAHRLQPVRVILVIIGNVVNINLHSWRVPSRKPVKQNRFSSTLGLLANASHLEQLEQQVQELTEQRLLLQKQLEAQKDQSQQLQDLNDQISQLKQMQQQQTEQIQHYKAEGASGDNINKGAQNNNVAELLQTPSKSSLFSLSPLTKRRLNNELKFKNESR